MFFRTSQLLLQNWRAGHHFMPGINKNAHAETAGTEGSGWFHRRAVKGWNREYAGATVVAPKTMSFSRHCLCFFRPESVGQSLITVLKQGKHGSLWVCEDNGLIYEIEISTLEAAKRESLLEKWLFWDCSFSVIINVPNKILAILQVHTFMLHLRHIYSAYWIINISPLGVRI